MKTTAAAFIAGIRKRMVLKKRQPHVDYGITRHRTYHVVQQDESIRDRIERLYREEELEIPYKALRECCTNALCHRLYHRPGSSVGIAIYDDRVEIENSGTFPPDMTMEKLLSGHNSEP